MELLSSPIAQFIWKVIGAICLLKGIGVLGVSAQQSLSASKGGNIFKKVSSVLDELLFAIILLTGVIIIFYINDLGIVISFFVRILLWAWSTFFIPLLQFLGVPIE